MTFQELQNSLRPYRGVLAQESVLSRPHRKLLRDLIAILLMLLLAAIQFGYLSASSQVFGTFYLLIAALLVLALSEAFYFSAYFHGLDAILREENLSDKAHAVTYEVASLVHHTDSKDITGGFLRSAAAAHIMARCGIFQNETDDFLKDRKVFLDAGSFTGIACVDEEGGVSLYDYASAIFKNDEELRTFLFQHEIQEKEFLGAAGWVEHGIREENLDKRFWGRDHLGRISGIAKDWSYGGAYTLQKYAADITDISSEAAGNGAHGDAEADEVEKILSRGRDANVLLVGDDEVRTKAILALLAERIRSGKVFLPLKHKHIFSLNSSLLSDSVHEKSAFENELIHILNESIAAGNVILAFEDFPLFLSNAKALNSDAVALMQNYLGSGALQIVAFSSTSAFHETLETNGSLMQHFEKVTVASVGEKNILTTLEKNALRLERQHGVFFTYPALLAVSENAARFFADSTPEDKALDILAELIPSALARKKSLIEKSDVETLVTAKTGIPSGEVAPIEREKLTNLEATLHKRIIGQDEAVTAISNAMRRARSGVSNAERPMGSFLFIGPTGVGKTETTKALAATFFGDESKIIRLDMSEYRTDDALSRLIGSFQTAKQGVLSSMLRQYPYGVLLLDEFEKTNKEVLDLFLQILDEGFFSDMTGKRVNARNLIIIATSNAGSDSIFKNVEQGKNLADFKDSLVDSIVEQGIFKPELLNRFDGVILFKPLGTAELRQIATLMLQKLQKRLRDKGVELVINDAVLNEVIQAGTDPKFGARPMNRAVQDKVEQVIADKMIRGDIAPGSKVELSQSDFAQKF